MEIVGRSLSLPRNFLFLDRLPARFAILVLSRGATQKSGTAFEVEILGQRLVLHSQVELKVGKKYELEKSGTLSFRIVKEEKDESSNRLEGGTSLSKTQPQDETVLPPLFHTPDATPTDILALKVWQDGGGLLKALPESDKFIFDAGGEFSFKGVFVPSGKGDFTLFVTGKSADEADVSSLAQELLHLHISKVVRVSWPIFERIAQGAVDISS